MKKKPKVNCRTGTVGGQAVIEGVMMKQSKKYSVAVRTPGGKIKVETKEYVSVGKKYPVLALPLIRGVVNMVEMMIISFRTLNYSADIYASEEPQKADVGETSQDMADDQLSDTAAKNAEDGSVCPEEPRTLGTENTAESVFDSGKENLNDGEKPYTNTEKSGSGDDKQLSAAKEAGSEDDKQLSAAKEAGSEDEKQFSAGPPEQKNNLPDTKDGVANTASGKSGKKDKKEESGGLGIVLTVISVIIGLALGVFLFMFLPSFVTSQISKAVPGGLGWWKNLIEGLLKVIIFIGYLLLALLMKDIRRTFEYHGAEHKTIFCYEAGVELTPENVKKFKRFHPRCGTSFIVVILIIGIIFSSLPFITWSNAFLRTLVKLLFLPVTVAVGYEYIRFAGRHSNIVTKILSAPGLWLQRITTREPDYDQIEVAICALKTALGDDFIGPDSDDTEPEGDRSPVTDRAEPVFSDGDGKFRATADSTDNDKKTV